MEQSYAIKPFEAYREGFTPVQRIQQEGLKALGRFTRFQFTVAGALLEHNLAGVQAMVSAATPMEYFAKQSQLNSRFVEKVAIHTREFLKETADRSFLEIAASTNVAPPEEEVMDVENVAMDVEEDEEMAVQLLEADEIPEDEPSVESIEAQPDESESSTPKSTASKQGRKRSDRSRRGQANH